MEDNKEQKEIPLAKFKVGDRVRVIKYGNLIWVNKKEYNGRRMNFPVWSEGESFIVYDMSPELVNKIGIIEKLSLVSSTWNYIITGIPGKTAWYDEKQLELI